jgi:predicted nucleotidyltransferase
MSDTDIRGVYLPDADEVISILPVIEQVSDDKSDITFYSLKRFFELTSQNNPNCVELLFPSSDCILQCTDPMKKILDNRNIFISKLAKYKYCGYAFAQIKKAKGQNKFVNNPLSKEHPKREEHCTFLSEKSFPPMRPIKFGEEGFPDLNKLSVSRVSGSKELFRLYQLPGAKGVFDEMGNILFATHTIEDEEKYYVGTLQYSKESYESVVRQWKNYWEWKNNRNEARWKDYDDKEFECDFKNLAHCVRLMISGKNILLNGEPVVRLKGDDLTLVKEVRSGKLPYSEIMKWVEAEEKKFDEWYELSPLPHSVDMHKIDKLFKEIIYEYVLLK